MSMVSVTCPCGTAHEVPVAMLTAIETRTEVSEDARLAIPCRRCARYILTEILGLKKAEKPVSKDEDRMAEIDYDGIEHETPDAVMFDIDNKLVWLPKSQIEFDRDDKTIELPEWLATEKGLV